jgi:hypothetical protein
MPFFLKKFAFFLLKITLSIFLVLMLILIVLYLQAKVFEFPIEHPFAGNYIFNPYHTLPDQVFKANFHAHSKAWANITHGSNTEEEVYSAYSDKKYDMACISNYHKITPHQADKYHHSIPVYEHGFNIKKAHYLAMNAHSVSYLDFPLWQSDSHQQTMINTLRHHADMVAIAHPKFGGGRSFEGIKRLVGYHFMEVANHYRNSEEFWDYALSAGRLSWVLGNDDIHDLKDPTIFKRWNMIFADAQHRDTLMANLKKGLSYIVETDDGIPDNAFISCTNDTTGTYTFRFAHDADTILVKGQDGAVRQQQLNAASTTYSFRNDDTYIRVVAINNGSKIYLNPLVRYDGVHVPLAAEMRAQEKVFLTWLIRCILLGLGVIIILSLKKTLMSGLGMRSKST